MKISELRAGMGNVNIKARVIKKEETRTVNTKNGARRVANLVIEDEDKNTIKLSLWEDEIEKVKEGDEIEIENGYVSEFRGELQLSLGRYGKIISLKH
ncbi:MAG: single-stranded DNA binding protein Ssb [Candidatus Micrarchaeota archaeon]|nr:MAG: single-stranded DNA binding protein Ssb [Candidatus Micrarchaeota archaeon]